MQRREYLTQFREHLKAWRLMNGVVLKLVTTQALRDIKARSGPGYTKEMVKLINQAKRMCRYQYLDSQYVADTLDLHPDFYQDAKAILALTYDRKAPRLVGFGVFATNEPHLVEPPMEWRLRTLQNQADSRQVGEIVLACTSDTNTIKGLGRFLTLQMLYEMAKSRYRGRERYNAYVLEAAGGHNATASNSDLSTRNYHIFKQIGFKQEAALAAGTRSVYKKQFTDIDTNQVVSYKPVFMSIRPTAAYKPVPLKTLQDTLNIPDLHGICPERAGTGQTRCQQWINRPRQTNSSPSPRRSGRTRKTRSPR